MFPLTAIVRLLEADWWSFLTHLWVQRAGKQRREEAALTGTSAGLRKNNRSERKPCKFRSYQPRVKGIFDLFLAFDEDGALGADDIACNSTRAHVRPTPPPAVTTATFRESDQKGRYCPFNSLKLIFIIFEGNIPKHTQLVRANALLC